MKMTRRNFISASAAAMLACGASLSAHAAENTTENGLNFITDIFKDPTQPGETEGATTITAETNAEWYEKLDFSDRREFANAERGWLDNAEGRIIDGDDNRSAWDLQSYGDLNRDAPDTVNPSLWRNTQLNAKAGLFEVCDGIYQVRGFDMANTTFIRTDHGWIVFDVLMCKENMKAAKELMENRFGPLDIKAVLYSHSHVDHFGGVEGVITREQVADAKLSLKKQLASGKTLVLAPAGFLKHAISENVYAGIAMARRAQFQYGTVLDKGEKGALSVGIGMGQSTGTVGLIAPTYEIGEDVPKLTIDGLEIEFQLTPGTEAPAEMNAYFPKYRALWMAENCTGTLHNLYTLRGAEVRDANDWAKYIIEADQRFCEKTDVVFQSHNWPHWGEEIHDYLLNTAAIYKFIHDQTLHYMNQGYTSTEVAAMLTLPEKLEKVWYTRPYYGTLAHNAKAVYQKYLGWYDANPVNLNPLPPSDTAKKLVEYLGSTDAVLRKARKDFEKGRLSVGGADHQGVGLCRPVQPEGAQPVRRCAGAVGLSGRVRRMAQRLPDGRCRAAQGQPVRSGTHRQWSGLRHEGDDRGYAAGLHFHPDRRQRRPERRRNAEPDRDGCERKVLCDPKKRYSAVLFGREPPGRAGHGHLQAAAAPCSDAGAAGRSGAGKRRCHCPEASAGVCVQV